jgi:adenylyltransferase/sulfurtransferase
MYFASIDIFKKVSCPACQASKAVPKAREKLVWLCGRNTVNVNPEKPLRLKLSEVYELIKQQFRIRVKSQLAIIFEYKNYEISLFNDGRMLIKNARDEESALRAYREVVRKLGLAK